MEDGGKDCFDYVSWQRHRRLTMISMLLVNFVGGIDLSIILTTVVPYLQNTLHVENTNTFYACITTVFCLSSALFGLVSGRLVDKTRRIKLFTRVTLTMQIVGNLIYTLPFSPYYPLLGRLIAGAGESFTAVCIGEVIRIYDMKGSNNVICWLATVSSFGYVIGPIMSIPLSMSKFSIGPVRFDRYNTPGLVIAILAGVVLVACEFMVHDCSLQLDMKMMLKRYALTDEADVELYIMKELNCAEDEKDGEESEGEYSNENSGLLKKNCAARKCSNLNGLEGDKTNKNGNGGNSVLDVMKTFDHWLMFLFSFLTMYLIASGESLIPLINFKVLKWNLNILAASIFGYGVILFLTSVLVSKICTSPKSMYHIGYFSIPAIILSYSGLLIISLPTEPRDSIRDGMSMFLFVFCLVFVWFFESIALRSMLGRMVPSHLQSFAEAFRNGIARCGMILSSFVTPFLMSNLTIYSMTCISIGAVMFLVYFSRRRQLTEGYKENEKNVNFP